MSTSTIYLDADVSNAYRGPCKRRSERGDFAVETLGNLTLEDGDMQVVWLANLSEHGIGFWSIGPLKTGTQVTVALKKGEGNPLVLQATVKHSTPNPKWYWQIGCEFHKPLSTKTVRDLLAAE